SSDEASSLAKPDVIVPKITIRMIEAISPDQMVVSGSIEGEGSVEVMIANTLAVTNIEDDSYMAKAAIPAEDRFAVAVSMSDEEGTILSSAKIVLNKSKLDETLSGNALIVVQKGDALWRIAYKTYGQGIRYVDIYQSNQKEIGDPNLIYPDQVFVVPNP
ncbi:MAG: LysM peptidoglycan-binding domain-containing protein, partial [Candidatus Puniceispirillales bacterium]